MENENQWIPEENNGYAKEAEPERVSVQEGHVLPPDTEDLSAHTLQAPPAADSQAQENSGADAGSWSAARVPEEWAAPFQENGPEGAGTRRTPPMRPAGRPGRSGDGIMAAVLIGVAMAAIVLVTLVVSQLGGYNLANSENAAASPGLWLPLPGEGEAAAEPTATKGTTIPAYAPGDGTTMEISAAPEGGPLTLTEIYKKCAPSIVAVEVTTAEGIGAGTGIILSHNGYILTNEHVVAGGKQAAIILQDGTEYDGALVGVDTQSDLAVLKIEAAGLTPAEFGDSGALEIGEEVAAIGNPLGQNFSLSNGIVSALNRDVDYDGFSMRMIQTNAAINEGNSGGALLNMYGQVVGITNMKLMSYYSTVEGMAFAIPTKEAQPIVNLLLAQGVVTGRPSIGITVRNLSEAEKTVYGLDGGVYVISVHKAADAYEKLEAGDVITAVSGTPVANTDALSKIKNSYAVGDVLSLAVFRDGETLEITVLLADTNDLA